MISTMISVIAAVCRSLNDNRHSMVFNCLNLLKNNDIKSLLWKLSCRNFRQNHTF